MLLMSLFKERWGGNREKPSTTQHRERHLGSWPPDALLGVSAKRPACANNHPAGRVCTLHPRVHLQGEDRATKWSSPGDARLNLTWEMKDICINPLCLLVLIPQAHQLDPTKHYLRLKFLIENQVQFYIPKPEEDICDLVRHRCPEYNPSFSFTRSQKRLRSRNGVKEAWGLVL